MALADGGSAAYWRAQPARRAPAPVRRRVLPRKPRGVYTRGTVRSTGARTTPAVAPATQRYMGPVPRPAPPRRAPAPVYRAAPAPRPASGGAGVGTGIPSALSGAPGAYGGVPSYGMPNDTALRAQATRAVRLEVHPQIAARQFAGSEENRAYAALTAKLTKQLGLSKGDVAALYDALSANLAQGAAKTQQGYSAAQSSVGSKYDQLISMLGQDYSGAKQSVTDELARLGVANPNATATLTRQQALQTGAAAGQKAIANSTLESLAAAAAGEMANLRGAAQSTGPMLQSQLQRAYDEKSADVALSHSAALRRLAFEIAQLRGSEPGKIEQTLAALREAAYQKAQDAAQTQFMNSIRAAQLGISSGQLDVARENAATSRASAISAAQARQAAAARAKQPAMTGIERAYTFMRGGYRGRVPQGNLQQALVDIINGNSNDPGWRPGTGVPGFDVRYVDQYMRDVDRAVRDRLGQGWGAAERDLLRNAILKYFGR